MKYIGKIIILILCLTFLLFTSCKANIIKPETVSGDLENQEDINPSSSNSQIANTETPVIVDSEDSDTVYPQKWATGDGTANNPWANDCIKKAYDAVPIGGTIFLKAGYYTLSSILVPTKSVNIIGEGRDKTFIKPTMTTTLAIHIEDQSYITLKGFTIDGDSQTGKAVSIINLNNSEYLTIEDIEVMNAFNDGINVYEINHSSFRNLYEHDNGGHGMHPGSDTAGKNMYNTYQNIYAWNNGNFGFYDRGNGEVGLPMEECYNVYDNIQAWDNGLYGISINFQKGATISNCHATGNGSCGFDFGGLENSNITNCTATLNGINNDKSGIWMEGSDNLNLTNVIVLNNNSGFELFGCTDIKFNSCQSYDDREIPVQYWGLALSGTNTGIILVNCKLSPNADGEMYNPAGAVVTVITEKMLAKL